MSTRRSNKFDANSSKVGKSRRGQYSASVYVPPPDPPAPPKVPVQASAPPKGCGTRKQVPMPVMTIVPENIVQAPPSSPAPQRQSNSRSKFSRPVFTIPIIPVDFNSFQVRMLCDTIWDKFSINPASAFRELRELLDFFELLRKAIIQVNVKSADKVKHLNPAFQTLLSSFEISSKPDPEHSWFTTEKAPRPDNSREYDEESWSKMFIQMLPRAHHTFPVTVPIFQLLGEISQQITQSEVATIRHELISKNSDSMHQDVRSLEKQADRENWSEEKFAEEMKKIEAHYNVIIYEARQKRLAEINKMYDDMYAYVTPANVNNFNDHKVLSMWRFITRNPCFPNASVTFGTITIPGDQLSLVELYNHKPTVFSTNYANLYSWFYTTFPNVDAANVSLAEYNAWLQVSTFLKVSQELFDLSFKPFSIVDLTRFDNQMFSFYENWQSSQFGAVAKQVQNSTPGSRWFNDASRFPYSKLGLLPPNYVPSILKLLNRLTTSNYLAILPILQVFDLNVVLSQILETVSMMQDRIVPIACKVALELGISSDDLFKGLINIVSSNPNCLVTPMLHSALPILLIQEDFDSAFSQFAKLLPKDHLQVEIFHGIVRIPSIPSLFSSEIVSNKGSILSIVTPFSKGGNCMITYYASDVLEALAKLQ